MRSNTVWEAMRSDAAGETRRRESAPNHRTRFFAISSLILAAWSLAIVIATLVLAS